VGDAARRPAFFEQALGRATSFSRTFSSERSMHLGLSWRTFKSIARRTQALLSSAFLHPKKGKALAKPDTSFAIDK
jgi:hypothetical protein